VIQVQYKYNGQWQPVLKALSWQSAQEYVTAHPPEMQTNFRIEEIRK